jgi:hypothetical protein
MKAFWILYCAMQAVPALDPTPHLAVDSQEKCLEQARISNSFNELHCVCSKGEPLLDEGILLHIPGEGVVKERPPSPLVASTPTMISEAATVRTPSALVRAIARPVGAGVVRDWGSFQDQASEERVPRPHPLRAPANQRDSGKAQDSRNAPGEGNRP